MTVYLARRDYHYSAVTVHKNRNTERRRHSLVRPKRPNYRRRKPHKVFENKLRQEFRAEQANQKWGTDFTYLFLKNGKCAITAASLTCMTVAWYPVCYHFTVRLSAASGGQMVQMRIPEISLISGLQAQNKHDLCR